MDNNNKIKFNDRKFEEAILFLLSQFPMQTIEGKKKLAKLLYFADFNCFEFYEIPLTGASYRALPMGPVPDELEKTLQKLKGKQINIVEKNIGLEKDLVVFSLVGNKDDLVFANLSEKEKNILKKVYKDYGGLSGLTLENITHSEAPYNAVVQGEYIPYELSFYRDKTKEDLVGV